MCVLAAVLLLSACQQNPDSSIVVNKDMDRLIEEAGKEEGAAVELTDMAENYDSYQTTLQDDSMRVTINVDAKVDIPQTEQMSVMRVRQQPVSQELLNQVIEELGEGETLYDGAKTVSAPTRSDIENDISSYKSEMEMLKESHDEDEISDSLAELQRKIDELQAEYENTPAEIVWEGNESDGLIHSAAEMNEKSGGIDFYDWEYSLNPDGEVFYGVNDGENGTYAAFFVQNNEDYGNCIRYRRGRHGYEFVASANTSSTDFENQGYGIWDPEDDISKQDEHDMKDEVEDDMVEYTDEAATLLETEARTEADTLLEKLGFSDFQYYEGGLYNEMVDIRKTNEHGYRKVYIFKYMRNIDGAFVTFDVAGKHDEGWDGNVYVKKYWPVECIEIRVNDDGIVGFDYNAPLAIEEVIVDRASMKSFEEIRDIFEQMAVVTNAQTEIDSDTPEGNVSIQVDRVILGYARISEADSYDTGLLVPVWDFRGEITNLYGYTEVGSVLTINAIDGSIIDRSIGY